RDGEDVVVHADRAFPAQVPVGVVAEVDDGGLVGGGAVVDVQLVAGLERVGGGGGERSGIALVAVGADVAQRHAGFGRLHHLHHLPHHLVEALGAAVQRVRAVVEGEPI